MAEGTITVHFKKNTNIPGRRFFAGQDVPLPEDVANRLLDHKTDTGEPVCVKTDSAPPLDRLSRDELNAKAVEAGIENPAELPNKSEVIAALVSKGVTE